MANIYRLDIRYVPEAGVSAMKRLDLLTGQIIEGGYSVSDVAVFDDGMRISLNVGCEKPGRHELALLALVSNTGIVGRFSCRDLDKLEQSELDAARESETALA